MTNDRWMALKTAVGPPPVHTPFDVWMREVDLYLLKLIGFTTSDLIDCPYADWFDDGVGPRAAARAAIKNEKGEFDG